MSKARCTHCKRELTSNSKCGTSHLKHHLERCPHKMHQDIKQYMLSAETNADGSTVLNKVKYDDSESRRAIMFYLIEEMGPFITVQKRGFRRMTRRLNSQFKPFSRQTAMRELFAMFVKERDNLKEFIAKAHGKVCLTTDNWKCKYNREEYICVTAHFVDSNWCLQKRIIRFRSLVPPYDSTVFLMS
ncbi:hypothetical protein RND71_004856 [Anisodus tanguticus]|uniref:BED-type domain-containing protein n=1 Tax=Anisodus tanguticus TaxID=243964 RepID=A0AAE1SQR0_9SOLA|nr:hypothetical protein RND71_004856 [Anisodus tanguticus]